MSPFARMFPVGLAALLAVLVAAVGCAEKDPLEKARDLLQEGKLGEATTILKQLHEKDPEAYEPIFLLAQAAEQREDVDAIVTWYEKALASPEGKRTEKLLQQQLHPALVAQAKKQSAFPDKYEELLKRPAALEEELRLENTPANEALFNLYKVRFESAKKGKRFDDAIAVAAKMDKLYYDREAIRAYTKQERELKKQRFLHGVQTAFDEKLKADLLKTGRYDMDDEAITLSFTFTVPAPQDDGLFDPRSEEFLKQVQYAACWGGLRDAYAKLLNEWAKASPVGRELAEEHVNAFLNRALQGQQPTWQGDEFDPGREHRRSAEGLQMVCAGSLPVDFVVENFRKVDLMFKKQAAEGEKKKGDEEKGDEEKGDEEKGDAEKSDEDKGDADKGDEEKGDGA